eukprot:47511-Pelagomonas_calceolata.AAC.1
MKSESGVIDDLVYTQSMLGTLGKGSSVIRRTLFEGQQCDQGNHMPLKPTSGSSDTVVQLVLSAVCALLPRAQESNGQDHSLDAWSTDPWDFVAAVVPAKSLPKVYTGTNKVCNSQALRVQCLVPVCVGMGFIHDC